MTVLGHNTRLKSEPPPTPQYYKDCGLSRPSSIYSLEISLPRPWVTQISGNLVLYKEQEPWVKMPLCDRDRVF